MSGRARGRRGGASNLRSGRTYQPTEYQPTDIHVSPSRGVKCAPRDTSTADTVSYAVNAGGSLNKYHASFKHERNKLAVDNIKINNESLYTMNKKPTTQIMGLDVDTNKILLMAIADSDENNFVDLIATVFEKAITSTGETQIRRLWDNLLSNDGRYNDIMAGETLQQVVNEFFDNNTEFSLLKFGAGDEDTDHGNLSQVIQEECTNNYKPLLDDVINNIINGFSGEHENFVNHEDLMEKIDNSVFQHIRETFNIKKRISKDNVITNILLKYNVQTLNKVANHVSKVTDTVAKHGEFILEQAQYNETQENDKANCTLVLRDLDKFELPLEEGQRGKQFSSAVKRTQKFLKDNKVELDGVFSINSFSTKFNTIRIRFRTTNLRNEAEYILRSRFESHKHRTNRAECDYYPGENKPDLAQIKNELLSMFKTATHNEIAIPTKTWNEHIFVNFIKTEGKYRKNYIEFSDPTCPNHSLLVFNYSLPITNADRNPFRNFDFSMDIPNPVLREQLASNPEKYEFYTWRFYGVHKRIGFTRKQWRDLENYWTTNKVMPGSAHINPTPTPAPRDAGEEQ